MGTSFPRIFEQLKDRSRPWRRRYGLKPLSEKLRAFALLRIAHFNRRSLQARVIGITGSSGKSTTTSILDHLLKGAGKVHSQIQFNTLLKLPGTINSTPPDTRFLVAEVGVTTIGSMAPMARLLRPDIAVVTKVGLEHYSAFRNRETVSAEKGKLVEVLPENGLAVLNADDPHVMSMRERTRARIVTFGWAEDADYRVMQSHVAYPDPLRVTIRCAQGTYEILTPYPSKDFWLAVTASFATAMELGLDPEMLLERFATLAPLWDRCGILKTGNGPTFIMDTVKAPNESIPAAIATLGAINAPYKRSIIGHIADYAGNPKKPYRVAYELSREAADQVIFVGDNIHRAPATEDERANGTYKGFTTTKEAADYIKETARADELILLKGARNSHLERIGLAWTHEVRCWEQYCGLSMNCLQCGKVEVPFEEHAKMRRKERRKAWFSRRRRQPQDAAEEQKP